MKRGNDYLYTHFNMQKSYNQLYTYKFENLDKMDTFLERYKGQNDRKK